MVRSAARRRALRAGAQGARRADRRPRVSRARLQPSLRARRESRVTAALRSTRASSRVEVVRGIGDAEFDREGRYVEARFRGVAVVSAYFPFGLVEPCSAGSQVSVPRGVRSPARRAQGARIAVRVLRRLQHGSPGHRSEELAVAAGLPRLHAARARVARLVVRGPRLRRCVSRRQPGAAPVHVVVE